MLFCLGHAPICHSKKDYHSFVGEITCGHGVSLAIAIIFEERNCIEYVITIILRKYWNTPEVLINFDIGRKNVLAMILVSFIVLLM